MNEKTAMSVDELVEQGYEEDPEIAKNWENSFSIVKTPGCLLFVVGMAGIFAAVLQIGPAILTQETWLTIIGVGAVLLIVPTLWASFISSPRSPATGQRMQRFSYSQKGGRVAVFVCHDSMTFCRRVMYYQQ